MTREEVWRTVEASARALGDDKHTKSALSQACYDWAKANGWVQAAGGPVAPSTGGVVFPNYGKSKGLPIAGASRSDLEFYANGCRRTLADPEKARWHDKERTLLAAIEAELSK